MRTNFGTILAALIATGCSHSGKATTEEIRQDQTAYAEADTAGGMTQSDQNPACPMQIAGTSVRTEETVSGPALAFTTTGDVDGLRMRVRRMASAENRAMKAQPPRAMAPTASKESLARASGFPNAGSSGATPDKAAVPNMYSFDSYEAPGGSTSTQGSLMHDSQGMPGTPVRPGTTQRPALARAESTESGARLVFVIEDASQIERVRDRVQTSAQTLAAGRCPATAVQNTKTTGSYQRPAAGGY